VFQVRVLAEATTRQRAPFGHRRPCRHDRLSTLDNRLSRREIELADRDAKEKAEIWVAITCPV
jgi:hypothetical protein